MFNLSGSEMIFLLLIALVVLGPEKLQEAVRRFGKAYGEFKKVTSGFQTELRSALDEPMREMRDTADAMRKAANLDFNFDGSSEPSPAAAVADQPTPGQAQFDPAFAATDATTGAFPADPAFAATDATTGAFPADPAFAATDATTGAFPTDTRTAAGPTDAPPTAAAEVSAPVDATEASAAAPSIDAGSIDAVSIGAVSDDAAPMGTDAASSGERGAPADALSPGGVEAGAHNPLDGVTNPMSAPAAEGWRLQVRNSAVVEQASGASAAPTPSGWSTITPAPAASPVAAPVPVEHTPAVPTPSGWSPVTNGTPTIGTPTNGTPGAAPVSTGDDTVGDDISGNAGDAVVSISGNPGNAGDASRLDGSTVVVPGANEVASE